MFNPCRAHHNLLKTLGSHSGRNSPLGTNRQHQAQIGIDIRGESADSVRGPFMLLFAPSFEREK